MSYLEPNASSLKCKKIFYFARGDILGPIFSTRLCGSGRCPNKIADFIRNYLNQNCKLVSLDETYPDFVKSNLEYFKSYEFIDF